jgi:hypothetical protein
MNSMALIHHHHQQVPKPTGKRGVTANQLSFGAWRGISHAVMLSNAATRDFV